jgi:galactokinase/mevalonate kinase-like predicted kinase
MYLVNTNIVRNSTNILKTIDVEKSFPLLSLTDDFEQSILKKKEESFFDIFNQGWKTKKTTSKEILNDNILLALDLFLNDIQGVKGIKLCGAGGGGYFLVFVEKAKKSLFEAVLLEKMPDNTFINISIDSKGIQGINI